LKKNNQQIMPHENKKYFFTNRDLELSRERESEVRSSKFEKSLIKIYKEQNKHDIDMSKIERKKKRNKIFSFLMTLIILFIIAWLGYLIFNPASKFAEERIKLEIEGPSNILAGEDMSYIIKYGNQEKINLNNAQIIAYLPDGFSIKETNPLSSSRTETNGATSRVNTWDLGNLKVGQTGKIEIKGKTISPPGTTETITATISYKPANFNSEFQKTSSLDTQVTSSLFTINIEGSPQITIEEKITFKIKYKNNLEDQRKNAKITVFYPLGFSPEKLSPQASSEKLSGGLAGNIWYKDDLEYNKEEIIEITGSFSKESSGKKDLKATIELKEGDNLYPQEEKIFSTEIVKEGLILNLIINGGTENKSIVPGDFLNYSIVYRNNGQLNMSELEIKANLNGEILDWQTLDDKNNGIKETNQITWNKDLVSGLGLLPPGNQGSIDFKIKIKSLSDLTSLDKTKLQAESIVEVKIGKINDLESNVILKSNTIITKIATDLNLEVEGKYFNDDNIAIGSGPIPPKVGETTSYQIFWNLTNTIHEVKNVKITTSLPANVIWTEKTNIGAGQINFNPETRQIAWTINRIPLGTPRLVANFELSITPNESQVGRILILTPEVNLQAIDSETESEITKTGEGITTNLETDPMVKGKGIVIK
jgi:hypothetical protein